MLMRSKAIEADLTHPKYRPDIDGLRAIAVLSVVAFHAFPNQIRGGFIGVDIFFVISGFLISTIIFENLDRGTFSYAEFYSRRVKRIFPALLLMLAACFACGWQLMQADEFKQLGKHIAGGAGFVSNLVLWNESGYFDTAAETKPLLHLWSLGIEEQFYIVWPILLWAVWKWRRHIVAIVAVLALASFALNLNAMHADAIADFYSPQTRFWELLIGSMLAALTLYKKDMIDASTPRRKNQLALTGFLMLLIALAVTTKAKAFPGWYALLPTLGAAGIIAAGANARVNRVILSNPLLVRVGLISFPLYLWHWPLLVFARIAEGDIPSVEMRLAAIAAAMLLAWLTYRLVETPIRFGRHSGAKTLALAGFMLLMGYVGYNDYARDGLPFRAFIKQQDSGVSTLAKITDAYDFFEIKRMWRSGVCYSALAGATLDSKLAACVDQVKPLVFIWGDSYAAMLYPGLRALQKNSSRPFGIAEFANSNGPPFFDYSKRSSDWAHDNQTLLEINNEKLSAVEKTKPSVVLLSWMYNGLNGVADKALAIREIEITVGKIKTVSPATVVIVMGPVPHWKGFLKDVIVSYARKNDGHSPPAYTNFKLLEEPRQWDAYLQSELTKRGINYISTQAALCNEQGCLTRVGDGEKDMTAVDWGHLTPAGSAFLFEKIKDRILVNLH